jgi:tetratricopeptide (TPR) repeat protein
LLDAEPESGYLHGRRAKAYGRLEEWDKALVDCDKVIAFGFPGADIWFEKGLANEKKRRFEQAKDDYLKAIAVNPDNLHLGPTWEQLGKVHGELGQWDKALEAFSSALKLEPNEWRHYYWLGDAHAQLGQWEKAARVF